MIGDEAPQFRSWLQSDSLLGKLDPYSHAHEALPIEQNTIIQINNEVRSIQTAWYSEVDSWPDDDWIVGAMGNGDYYVVSRSGSYEGVWQYHHELREKEFLAPTLRAFYEYCIAIEREAGNL